MRNKRFLILPVEIKEHEYAGNGCSPQETCNGLSGVYIHLAPTKFLHRLATELCVDGQ